MQSGFDALYHIIIDTNPTVFIIFSLIMMGFIAFLSGKAIAENWKSPFFILVNTVLIGFADRFFTYALFEGQLLNWQTYIAHCLIYLIIMYISYRIMLTNKMVKQYPWIYKKSYLLWWTKKGNGIS